MFEEEVCIVRIKLQKTINMGDLTEKFNILIVDDRKENLLTLESIIDNPEVNIIHALSGNEALSITLDQDISLVLLDVQMPGIDGFETAELMRGSERTKDIPIVFITATYRNPDQIFRGYETGAVDYLYKPSTEGSCKARSVPTLNSSSKSMPSR